MRKMKQIVSLVIVTTILLALTACDSVSRLRSFFHPDESPQGLEGSTSLSLEILPATELDIFLDGELVSHQQDAIRQLRRQLSSEHHISPILAAEPLDDLVPSLPILCDFLARSRSTF